MRFEGVTAGFDEDLAFLGYYCVLTGKQLPTLRIIIVSSFSGSNSPIRSVCYFSWTDSPIVCKHANKVKEQCCELQCMLRIVSPIIVKYECV
jgi:hypothetical protein